MIKVDCNKGELTLRGPLESLLFEYTLLTRTVLKEMREQFGEEMANELFAGLGQIAAKNIDEVHNPTDILKDINEVFPDEV